MKRLIFLATIGIVLTATAGFFGCAETDDALTGGDPQDSLGTGTNPPTTEFALAGDMLDEVATTSGQTHLEVGMLLVDDLMGSPTSRGPRYIATGSSGPIVVDSMNHVTEWFIFYYSASLVDWEDTINVAGVDSIRFYDASGSWLTQPDSTVDGFELNSHTEGSISSENGSATTASHGAITFDGSFGGQMTINGTIYDTVSFVDASTGCTYSLATVSTWTNLLIDPTAMETEGGPSSGSLSLAASISTSCGAGASDSLEVSGDWTMNMTFSNGTSTITVSDGEQEWTYVQDDSDSGGGDSTGDSTWHDSTGDSTWPGDTTSDSTGDTTGPIDTTGDTTYYSYCDSLPQVELDSMKLWAYEDHAAHDDDASVPEVVQVTIEALQTIDTGLTNAFPFAAPFLDPSQATVAWDSSLQAYIIDYDMQMTFVDTTYYNDTMEIHNEEISIVGTDTATVWSGDSIVSLPSAAIDSISIRNEFYGMFVHNGVDTSQEWSNQTCRVSFTSLDSTATVTLYGTGATQVWAKRQIWTPDSSYVCTSLHNVNATFLHVAVDYNLFLDMEEGQGCPISGSVLSSVIVDQDCVGEWYCYADITGTWNTSQQFDAGVVAVSIDHVGSGLSWSFTESCSGPQSPRLSSRFARR